MVLSISNFSLNWLWLILVQSYPKILTQDFDYKLN